MSEVTAIPLRPITKGSLTKLWLGVAVVIVVAVGLAFWATSRQVAMAMTPAEYMAANAKHSDVVTTPSGLQYEVLKQGSGAKPTTGDIVLADYEGKLVNGDVFDASARHGGPQQLPLQGMIPGWTEGLQLMSPGARYRFWIPPELAYGEQGAPPRIPANAIVIFDVTLHDVMHAPGGMDMGAMPPGHGM